MLFEGHDDKSILDLITPHFKWLTETALSEELNHSAEMLKHTWGVSCGQNIGNARSRQTAHKVTAEITFDPDTEHYIMKRILRERRIGTCAKADDGKYLFSADVMDPVEMNKWLLSLSCRIGFRSGIFEGSSLENKIIRMMYCLNNKSPVAEVRPNYKNNRLDISYPPALTYALENLNLPASELNKQIFNPLFSVYAFCFADIFMEMVASDKDPIKKAMSDAKKSRDNKEYDRLFKKFTELLKNRTFEKYAALLRVNKTNSKNKIFSKTAPDDYNTFSKIDPTIRGIKFFEKNGAPLICTDRKPDYFMEILTLSSHERRWLLTILNDKRAGCFFDKKETIDKLIEFVKGADNLTPYDMENVICFDRWKYRDSNALKGEKYIGLLMKAAAAGHTVKLKCDANKHTYNGEYVPIFLTYSKKNDRFQGQFKASATGKFITVNIRNICNAEISDNTYDRQSVLSQYNRFLKKPTRFKTTRVCFVNENNLADRILSEFAPWKKACLVSTSEKKNNEIEKVFNLVIKYQKSDELEILIRLMSFGEFIWFDDDDDPLRIMMLRRLGRQLEIEQKLTQQLTHSESEDISKNQEHLDGNER